MQDGCINDGYFYISTTFFEYSVAKIVEDTMKFETVHVGSFKDSSNTFLLGESEGIEFDSDGTLYQYCTNATQGFHIGFICALNKNSDMYQLTTMGGLNLTSAYQTNWKRTPWQLASLAEIAFIDYPANIGAINVTGNESVIDPAGIIYVTKPFTLIIGSGTTLTIPALVCQSDNLAILNNGTLNFVCPFTLQGNNGACIDVATYVKGFLAFNNRGTLGNNRPSAPIIAMGYSKSPVIIGNLGSGAPITFESQLYQAQANTIYLGATMKITATS